MWFPTLSEIGTGPGENCGLCVCPQNRIHVFKQLEGKLCRAVIFTSHEYFHPFMEQCTSMQTVHAAVVAMEAWTQHKHTVIRVFELTRIIEWSSKFFSTDGYFSTIRLPCGHVTRDSRGWAVPDRASHQQSVSDSLGVSHQWTPVQCVVDDDGDDDRHAKEDWKSC